MNREKKLLLNTATGIAKQGVALICGFILPRYLLLYFGSEVNGLIASITQFLSIISLLEMGIGPVIQANLFKPLAEKDTRRISEIIKSSQRFFRMIALVFSGYVLFLCVFYPIVHNNGFSSTFTISLVLIIAISTFAQYYYGMTYQLLISADQKSYIHLSIQMITIILNTIICIILMKYGASIQIVKLVSTGIYVARPVLLNYYVRKHYNIDKTIVYEEEPIKQKWHGFAQHISYVVCTNVDVVLLTLFSSLSMVSVYSVYSMITNGVLTIVLTMATGLESYFGNLLAREEKEKLSKAFEMAELLTHIIVSIAFAITAITIVPFVMIYTKGIVDADYYVPTFGLIYSIAFASQCLKVPYSHLVKAAGHFKQTQAGAIISALINIIVSLMLVKKYSLVGVALGTLVAMLFHTVYYAIYLRKNILQRSIWIFFKYLLMDAFIFAISIIVSSHTITFSGDNYISWMINAFKVSILILVIAFSAACVFQPRCMMSAISIFKRHKGKQTNDIM